MEQLIGKLVDRADVVHLLNHKVRGIVVEAKVFAVDHGEHLPPDARRNGEVSSAGPLALGKEHRAVFNCNTNAVVLGELDDIRPDFGKELHVLRNAQILVSADKRIDRAHAELGCRNDELFDVVDGGLRLFRFRVERVGIVPQRGNLDTSLGELGLNRVYARRIERIHIDMGHARIAPLRLADRPTHHLHATVAMLRSKVNDGVERLIRQNGAGKSKLHGFGSLFVDDFITRKEELDNEKDGSFCFSCLNSIYHSLHNMSIIFSLFTRYIIFCYIFYI